MREAIAMKDRRYSMIVFAIFLKFISHFQQPFYHVKQSKKVQLQEG